MSVSAGETYLLPFPSEESPHLYVVLTEPTWVAKEGSPRVVIVSLTTKRGHSDTTVVLSSSDHSFLKTWTVAFYAKMLWVRVDELQNEAWRQYEDVAPDVLSRLQVGALDSPHTKPSIREVCERVISSTVGG